MSNLTKDSRAAAKSLREHLFRNKLWLNYFLNSFIREFKFAETSLSAAATISEGFDLAENYLNEAKESDIISDRPQNQIISSVGSGWGAFFGALEFGVCSSRMDLPDTEIPLILNSINKSINSLTALHRTGRWHVDLKPIHIRIKKVLEENSSSLSDQRVSLLRQITDKFSIKL